MAHQIILELPEVQFRKPRHEESSRCQIDSADLEYIKVIPVLINFQRLLANPKLHDDIFQGIPNKELLHAVAALYDQSLPEVTEDIIYGAVCEKWARTILLVLERDQALENFKSTALHKINDAIPSSKETHSNTDLVNSNGDAINQNLKDDTENALKEVETSKSNNENVILQENASLAISNLPKEENAVNVVSSSNESCESGNVTKPELHQTSTAEVSRFDDVFSDMESLDSEEEEETEDLLSGVDDFLANVKQRREDKQRWMNSLKDHNCLGEPTTLLGIEHRLLACATFEQSYDKPGHKVIHLTLISTRKRFRKMGLGCFMARIVRNSSIAGRYDAVVVNADHNAVDFFEKEGFTDDVLVNSKFADIGDTWFNCKRMCYLPPYQSVFSLDGPENSLPDAFLMELENLDLKQMELDIALFQEKSLQAFQAQASIVQRLRKEIILLRARVANQHDTIQMLTKENETVRDQKYECEKQFLKLKLETMTNAADKLHDLNLNEDEED